MAIEKLITDDSRGIEAAYWRLIAINIQIDGPVSAWRIFMKLHGFKTEALRNTPGSKPALFRDITVVGEEARALMLRPAGEVLREQGHDVDQWPAGIRAAADALSFYSQAASTLYGEAKDGEFAGAVDV